MPMAYRGYAAKRIFFLIIHGQYTAAAHTEYRNLYADNLKKSENHWQTGVFELLRK